MEITRGEVIRNELNQNAMGGSEQIMLQLSQRLDPELLKEFQIIGSRVRNLESDLYRIFVAHDLPGDPESDKVLANGGWAQFHKLVFISNWQMQAYMGHYQIPWSRCQVIKYALEPVSNVGRPDFVKGNPINIVYTPTPHRGLELLVPVFNKLCEMHDDIQLHVFSSFKLYGWEQRDEQYKGLFEFIENHPKMFNHGTKPNAEVRDFLGTQAHIFAYPSIWQETFCLSLLEAMSAGLTCVHPNFACLFETAADWTHMYQWTENKSDHANLFVNILHDVINGVREQDPALLNLQAGQQQYVKTFYNWNDRVLEWEATLRGIIHAAPPKDIAQPKQVFSYKTL